jgi:hypothetical protein
MAPVTQKRVDDDEAFDADLYDPAYFPRKVIRDGKGLRVRLSLTDGVPPDWMRSRAARCSTPAIISDHVAGGRCPAGVGDIDAL